ncbi:MULTISPECIES: pentapeptide repeat-containing protein [Halorussus]|uniref:pentapeptide repeat-containing protein n=1 Tax=Halorussus TaxID=1070314 RepID=UPI00209F1C10|nr:pentapeptide repeat-containing protein [Halorussus vallis]USZ74804.1 pentapeptide repeat-containing protein [Halorussus vallis]
MFDERCGYTYEAATLSDLGGVCCWRPTWEDTERCIWHANVPQKPTAALEAATPTLGQRLDGLTLTDVELSDTTWFAGRTLVDAQFVDCNFQDVDFSGSDLRHARFEGVDAQRARFTGANLEHAEFDRTDLRASNLEDARLHYAVFANVRVDESTLFGKRVVYEAELGERTDSEERIERFEAARWTYRTLQQLAEDNGLTRVAQRYYLRQKDLRRRLAWESGSYVRAVGEEGWRWTTGYGSSPWQVVTTSAMVILVCAVLYPLTGGIQEAADQRVITYTIENPDTAPGWYLGLVLFKSLYFSTVTFATLGYGDIQPVGTVARAIAGVEALTGQLLVALLVFVLTRNVTWSE